MRQKEQVMGDAEITKNYLLIFNQEVMYKPLIYKLTKVYNIGFNILEAKIFPRREGRLILGLMGSEGDLERGVEYLRAEGVEVSSIADDISRDEDRCVHCGACTAVCRTGALAVNKENMEVDFDPKACVACGQCELACPTRALSGVSIERLGAGRRGD